MTNEQKELQVADKKPLERGSGEPTRQGLMYVPQVDISEDKELITLRADLPGVSKDNLQIDLRDGVLTLTGAVQPPSSKWSPLYQEYEVGGFTRRFTIGERIAQDKISATLEDGVLTLVLPKAEAHKPRRIEIR